MSLRVWSPLHNIDRLQREVNRLFENTSEPQELQGEWSPRVDIYEDAEKFLFKVELPGLKATDVNLSLENNVLTLFGERKNEFEEKKQNFLRIERFYGSFRRSFQLPNTIDASNVNAEMKDGVLQLILAKRIEVQPKQIKIEVK
jgi:HSP20 family protein